MHELLQGTRRSTQVSCDVHERFDASSASDLDKLAHQRLRKDPENERPADTRSCSLYQLAISANSAPLQPALPPKDFTPSTNMSQQAQPPPNSTSLIQQQPESQPPASDPPTNNSKTLYPSPAHHPLTTPAHHPPNTPARQPQPGTLFTLLTFLGCALGIQLLIYYNAGRDSHAIIAVTQGTATLAASRRAERRLRSHPRLVAQVFRRCMDEREVDMAERLARFAAQRGLVSVEEGVGMLMEVEYV